MNRIFQKCPVFATMDIDKKEKDQLIHFAAIKGNVKAIEILVKYHADVNAANRSCYTPLILAAREDHLEVMQFLLENGA